MAPADRLVGGPDLAGGSVALRVGADINEVTFTNEVTRTPPAPPPAVKCTHTRGFWKKKAIVWVDESPGTTVTVAVRSTLELTMRAKGSVRIPVSS